MDNKKGLNSKISFNSKLSFKNWVYYTIYSYEKNGMVKKMDKCITRYNGKNTKAIACLFFPRRKVEYIEKKDLYPLRKIIFCGLEVNAPNNLTKYLTTHYGDYMSLPSEEERVSHRPYIVEI